MIGDTDHIEKMSERLGISPEDVDSFPFVDELMVSFKTQYDLLLSAGETPLRAFSLLAMTAFVAADAMLLNVQQEETKQARIK